MLKNKVTDFFKHVSSIVQNFWTSGSRFKSALLLFFKSWGRLILFITALVFFLYYPLGAYFVSHVDKNVDYDVRPDKASQSAVVEMAASLIDREVNQNLWTPNLPFFFPSFFLDNMPNFQLGMFSALDTTLDALSQKISPDNAVGGKKDELRLAADLLSYPGTVWLFDPQNKLKTAPSSARQYRKARRELMIFNQKLAKGEVSFYRSPQDLAFLLARMNRSLKESEHSLNVHVRELSSSWFDFKSDDVFFFAQGKAYGFLLMLKALAVDYRTEIVDRGLYDQWTQLLKALENAVLISPMLVRNADVNSSFAPNHLNYLRMQLLKAQLLAADIQRHLS